MSISLVKKKGRKSRPLPDSLPRAHFVEMQWVYVGGGWAEGAKALQAALPRDTRPERPAARYPLLAGTHWEGDVPPGNGPFYVPEWVFDDEELDEKTAALKSAGFRAEPAHVVILPPNAEYLSTAMRAAEDLPWTVNPRTYRAYLYPKLKRWKQRDLRPYNVDRLTL